ncbi:MAG: Na+/H+ antiporter [Thalassobius sp.]|nr:Na+/H+ antiporter [Thalassovita sp.]
MLESFVFYLTLTVVIIALILLARKIKVAYPVLLVIAGLIISFIPGIPKLHIEPELIFIIFLPPLLYEAAWQMSWKELWRWRRIVSSFAFLVVFLTALTVAVVTNSLIPGFTLALGFLLGGIVSPPDAVSAGAILKFVKVPRRTASILEGESLLNDASSLIIFQFALTAVNTGKFVWYNALGSFIWMLVGGIATGLLIGWVFMHIHKRILNDPNIDVMLSLVTPHIMYISAEEIHSSGVLAVVSGGLYLSSKRHTFLGSSSRLRSINVWESFSFILNGFVFIFIGLDLPQIITGLGKTELSDAIDYGIIITIVLIVIRLLASYGALAFTLVARNFITVADPRNPGWQAPITIGWAGMRGVVSLASALSIPVMLDNGLMFPQRNLILLITFIVILLTLIVQGLTLPLIIKKTNVKDLDYVKPEDEIDAEIHQKVIKQGYEYLKSEYKKELKHEPQLLKLYTKWEKKAFSEDNLKISERYKKIYIDVLSHQRQWLLEKNAKDEMLDENIIRKHLKLIDIEEVKLDLIK